MLRTKAMREREEQREKRLYRYALIRVRFPDGLVLQVRSRDAHGLVICLYIFLSTGYVLRARALPCCT